MAINIPSPQVGTFGSQEMINGLMENRLRRAQAERQEAMAKLPFGGVTVPGEAGKIAGLEMIKQKYGENSEQYKMALQAFNLGQKSIGSRAGYQDALSNTVGLRYTTPEGRGMIEQSNVSQGASPSGTPVGVPAVPGSPPYKSPYGNNQEAAGQYELERLKKNIPSPVLQKNLYATNIDKTLDNLNVDDLTQYSGLKGVANRASDAASASAGNAPARYVKYQEALTAADTLAKQVRQFYGDSITPSVQVGLRELTNPSSWMNNPKVAKAKYEKFKSILQQETQTYRSATQGSGVYTGRNTTNNPSENNTNPVNANPENADAQLQKWADEAIAQGADPAEVNAEMQRLRAGK